ncbi:RagB/SusD family nutrient uptake outer membrane protein [Porifericola rhodea]|uniref:RagB/SusD family nutrient uptake outer membrane protein n=1 Tax=Porifericola rhodea TaxID=930972 RepID=UPI002665E12C|nr:RagB/SusD family nutrient uptake outer membrane protein [Porifericola rhodea]WKN31494.1 RagB/SusD family nutrient uptake outer membrane protein [Porifericola rhodea]
MRQQHIILTFLCLLLGFTSCESLLEPVDENLLDEDRLNYDPAFAEGVLMNAYEALINQYDFMAVATDDAVTNTLSNGYRRMAVGEWSAQFNPASRWNKYEPVFYINKFIPTIENVQWKRDPEINELFKKRMIGEALAMRALHHFYILQAHAGQSQSGELLGIPYFSEFIESDGNFDVPRLSFEASVQAINEDFEEALTYLPMDYDDDISEIPAAYESFDPEAYKFVFGSSNNLRISGRIIKALQAKLALLAASPAFLDGAGDYYQRAAELSAALINDIGGVGGLDPGGLEFYDDDGDKYLPELLWRSSVYNGSWVELNHFPPSLNGEGKLNPSQNLVDAFPMENGYPIQHPSSGYDEGAPYQSRDPRLSKYILYNGNTIGWNTIYTGRGAGIDRIDSIAQRSTRSGYYLKKLLRPDVVISSDGTTTGQEHYNIFLRYTDIFLVFAEAANELGGPDLAINGISAREVISAIRQRAGISQPDAYLQSIASQDEMRTLIRNERRLELCFEGHRFWDMRRWKLNLNEDIRGVFYNGERYVPLEVEVRNYNDNAVYGPIPQQETVKFSSLEQNQGW